MYNEVPVMIVYGNAAPSSAAALSIINIASELLCVHVS